MQPKTIHATEDGNMMVMKMTMMVVVMTMMVLVMISCTKVVTYQNVLCFHVTVDQLFSVQILQSFGNIKCYLESLP